MRAADVTLDAAALERLHTGVAVPSGHAVFSVTGPGTVTCLQGLLTNDVAKPGNDSVVYGAFLTPKGMIVTDCWAIRETAERMILVVPEDGRAEALEIFRRGLPPRLARVADHAGDWGALWLIGVDAARAQAAGLGSVPAAEGSVTRLDASGVVLARLPAGAPAAFLAVGPAGALAALAVRLGEAGVPTGDRPLLEGARILAGWPALGLEIDQKTLPQEVRFDEIGGVSYTKGCYTGQETVARLHFRGHTNRNLVGLRWAAGAALEGNAILLGEREVGTLRSVLALPDRLVGLAPIRREVEPGAEVVAGGQPATVTALPFEG